ncbi:glutamine--fructose-6-phosphate transaminase (isomerizing) [Clostridiales Family XIII bacterium BX16]|uniref:Glutamine--fructose-6-phosphate aminotransferase [isomerizing] n=1 Tax=Lentihominibacter faecis TaxID=2764712 RepID=A0A923SMF8_9FIRM|nr:glutamine--fructose-6-phosphate transaminase (isomerizing) [Lentihominibacter faecis]MBC6000294.1 glutamine--fructose-6-phosphate transaminase (isomerizing) [Lentihominibacter faecis]
MCGIVGYVGEEHAKERIIDGLKRLEYRGYDSAGIALPINGKIEIRKHVGEIKNLEKIIGDAAYDSSVGIGHTRWATHGAPSDLNAHPHANGDNSIAIVHNGIIENYQEIKEWLIRDYGVKFKSETDSEVIAHLIGIYYDGDLLQAVNRAVEQMRGAYAVAAIAAAEPDKIVAVRKDAPLVAGIGKGFNFIASDIPALLKYVREVYLIENNETVVLTKDGIKIYNEDGKVVKRDVFHVTWDADAAEKEGYEHFMLKEIHEQPKGIQETLVRRLNEDGTINLDGISMTKEDIENFDKVYIVACGTAYHAGLVGKLVIEKMARVPVEVDIASEFRYRDPFVDEKTLFIAISQSGETLDTLAALREAKRKGARILSVVNVVGSSVARESDDVFYTWAGPEIAVASTKAYTTQLICMYLIGLYMGSTKGTIEKDYYTQVLEELKLLPEKVEKLFGEEDQIAALAKKYHRKDQVFYVGRGLDSGVSYEGSLKLKEISYINSFAIAAGELKHGTIALMEEETLVFALATQDFLYEKMVSNVEEIKARGARVVAIAKEGRTEIEQVADEVIYIPPCMDEVSPVLAVIPLQIFAYYVAKERGCNIDKPKNLAKSVTVE